MMMNKQDPTLSQLIQPRVIYTSPLKRIHTRSYQFSVPKVRILAEVESATPLLSLRFGKVDLDKLSGSTLTRHIDLF